jgi:glyoxylate/hydroxypyruvate reductase A
MTTPLRIAVALTRMTAEPWREAIARACVEAGLDADVQLWTGAPLQARYAAVWLPPADFFEQERNLRVLFNVGAGAEGLLAMPSLPPQLPVIRLVDAGMGPKMAEYVCFFIARITRGLDRFTGPQAVRDWNVDKPRGRPPTVGILGLGAIGAQIARAVAAFGYPVRGWSRTEKRIEGVQCFAGDDRLPAFLEQTNILVDVLPLTSDTRDLLDRARLSLLPKGAQLINVGRGGTIVDADLLSLLDEGHLAGAVLDVFRTEPLPDQHAFWRHPKVTVTPHLSGPTPRRPAAAQIAEAIVTLERGAAPSELPGFVERERGY